MRASHSRRPPPPLFAPPLLELLELELPLLVPAWPAVF
jgi:hypothetical protein